MWVYHGGESINKPKDWRFYRCGRPKHIAELCKGYIAAEKVEEQVWQAVERVLRDPTLIAAEIARQQSGTATEQDTLERERHAYEKPLTQCGKDIAR